MYYDFSIPIPEAPGKLVIKKKGDSSYVLYEIDRIYKKDKGYTIPKRVIIGKLVADDASEMFPNEKYELYFPTPNLPVDLPDASRSCCLKIGTFLAIQSVLCEYQLPSLLEKYFGEKTSLLLDLLSYSIVEEENVAQHYPDYAFSHPLFTKGMKIHSDSSISRFLSSIQEEQILGFLDDWNKDRDHQQRIYVSYDSTNKNCQAGDVDLVEFGKAKDEKGFPVFNLSLAFDKTNRVPLFYEEYPGSITDVSQLTFMVDKVLEYDYKIIGFILDRGYFSKNNIQYIDEQGFSFLLMVKGCKSLVADLVEANRNSFETRRDANIRSYRVYGTTVKSRMYEDDTKLRYFHLYFSAERQAVEREKLEVKIERMAEFLHKNEGKAIQFGRTYKEYFQLHYSKDGSLLYVEERADVIQKELGLCGYFCLVSSEKMTAEEALILYKGRDASEKLFAADKTFLGGKSMRVQSQEAISSKIFIEFLALIVRNRIYNLLKETMHRIETKPNYLTVPAALRELEKIEMVRRNKGYYQLDHAVTKKQKIILSSFGLDADSVREIAVQIGQDLVLAD